ncbi:MAG: CRISPR-associated helicase Cas3' [Chloroflexota bacterium]
MAIAHSRNQSGQQHALVDHLQAVAELTARYATPLGGKDTGFWLGLWHDLGKFCPGFQSYLAQCEAGEAHPRRVDHKAAGAELAIQHLGRAAMVIQGHHGGIRSVQEFRDWMQMRRLDPATQQSIKLAQTTISPLEPTHTVPIPEFAEKDALGAELWLRLLFSALVDADFLDTERHFNADKAAQRINAPTMSHLWNVFERNQASITGQTETTVGRIRHEVYQACVRAGEQPPGMFRLAVPTGGGKTRSALAFALRHAQLHGHTHIIVAVPFITITQQTTDVYRSIFGDADLEHPVVLEHHSGTERLEDEEDDYAPDRVWTRLAAENWDAPIVVTTTVQLFESLFSNGTSPCRKLHRLANAVIILDEAQALPTHLLEPMLDVLGQLCKNYGTSVVLSTATQPAFEVIDAFKSVNAREIVPQPARLFQALKRVDYEWQLDLSLTWDGVAELMRDESQALTVVNTKKDALALLAALDDPEALHLSTLLCGAHRLRVIREVAARLKKKQPCRLVSTQVIEAGVDLDFPLVLRAMGPMDSIIQAAGRCNREGNLERGKVIVFTPTDGGLPLGAYKTATGVTRAALGLGAIDLNNPVHATRYFEQLYRVVALDRASIQACRARFDYPEVARRFEMISPSESIVVTSYGGEGEQREVRHMLEALRRGTPDARLFRRRLQPYVVSVYSRLAEQYRRQGFIQAVAPGLGEWMGQYDGDLRGLVAEDLETDAFVV